MIFAGAASGGLPLRPCELDLRVGGRRRTAAYPEAEVDI